jgi:type II secretory pathway pseudopilin PulG
MLNRPRQYRKACSAKSGFTLVETTLALVILMFGLMMLAQLFAVAVSNYTMARSQMLATNVAQKRMDDLAGQYQAGVTLTNGSELVSVSNPNTNNQFSLYSVAWTITSGTRGAQTVQVTAVPVEPYGASTQVDLKCSLNKVVVLRSILSPVKH